MKTTILSAIYQGYDSLKPVCAQSIDTRWICVTDDPVTMAAAGDWEIVYEPRPHLHPNLAAKTPKMLPWLYTDTASSIWIDASFRVLSPTFAEEALGYADPIAQFSHPWRDCAYEEIEESLRLPKYQACKGDLEQQREILKANDHPTNFGLWATGVIARQHTPEVIRMGFDWLAQNHLYSYQDQASHPLVCRLNGIRPTDFPGLYFQHPWLRYEGSGQH